MDKELTKLEELVHAYYGNQTTANLSAIGKAIREDGAYALLEAVRRSETQDRNSYFNEYELPRIKEQLRTEILEEMNRAGELRLVVVASRLYSGPVA